KVHTDFNERPYWEDPDHEARREARKSETDAERHRMEVHAWYHFAKRWQKASELINKPVRNAENQDLGKIEELIVDPDSGGLIYAVLSYGGVLGVGDKWFAIPWFSMTLPEDAKYFVLDVDRDRLKNATGFDKKDYPNMVDPEWAAALHKYYGQRPYWQEVSG